MKAKHSFHFPLCILLFFNPIFIFAQGKQANNWYFGSHAGITFNQGSPPVAQTGNTATMNLWGSACISDEEGNLLFYSDGVTIWNKNHQVMTNGTNMGTVSTQGAIIIQNPSVPTLYYFFNFGYVNPSSQSFQYSVIDMSDGLGIVLPDKKRIQLFSNVAGQLSSVLHANNTDYWIVTHGFGNNNFVAFQVTGDSVATEPVISYSGTTLIAHNFGYMKISSDGKWIAIGNDGQEYTELLHFDNSSGTVGNQNIMTIGTGSYGVEFSPDNTKFYRNSGLVYQYDLTQITPENILASEELLTIDPVVSAALQLGPDGKIYVGNWGYTLHVIHNPNEDVPVCYFEYDAISLEDNLSFGELPTFMQSYLKDPEFVSDQYCAGNPTHFNVVNISGIDSVFWKFKDFPNSPNDTSTLFNPAYTFSGPGTYYPELTVYSGYLSKTVKDTITIYPVPLPDLGNDTSYCASDIINLTLDAGPGQTYSWNGAFPTSNQTLVVTAPGMYTVRVNDNGCFGRDTINIVQYSAPLVDTSNVSVNPAACGGADGSITGIVLSGPAYSSLEWQNSTGAVVGNNIDLTGVEAGIYILFIDYGNDCSLEPVIFEISNTSGPVITSITPESDHCSSGIGGFTVNVLPGPGAPYTYSLDGVNYTNNPAFTGLIAGPYTVTVKDVNGCIDPGTVTIPDTPGPIVTDSTSTPENGTAANGTITVTAVGDSLYYSLNSGTPQSNGTFTGLSQGAYTITITDKWGCERMVLMTVDRLIGTILSASAGDDYKCKKELAYSTLTADNFINVKEFMAVLQYDNTRLNCTGYNPSGDFPDIAVTDYTNRVQVQWSSQVPKTLPGTIQLVDLIFQTTEWGSADIKWDTAYCIFRDEYGNEIQTLLDSGVITINNPPELINQSLKTTFCEGERAELLVVNTNGTAPFSYNWEVPASVPVNNTDITIDSITVNQSGDYRLRISDANNCTDTLTIPVEVYALPTANFPANDTIFFEQQTTLTATEGYASYLWNNGDTTYYTIVTEEGEYSVLIQTDKGCQKTESVTMSDTYVDIKVPTAFTPNGDGLNDTFKPLINLERIRQYHIGIYNKWGQLIFETGNPTKSWEAINHPGGVYSWIIDYMNMIGKTSQIKGSVVVVR